MSFDYTYEPTDEMLSAVVEQLTKPSSYKNFLKKENKITRAIIASSTGIVDPNINDSAVKNNIIPADYHVFHYNASDNPTRLNRFLGNKDFLNKLEQNGWIKENKLIDIEYKINRHGLRCSNFSDQPGIIFIGCSHTYGTGVKEENIWPRLVSEHFGVETINFGCPGTSALVPTYHLLNCMPEITQPIAIVLLAPPVSRVDLLRENKNFLRITSMRQWLLNDLPEHKREQLISSSTLTSVLHYRLAEETLKTLSANLKIPYLSLEIGDFNLAKEDIDFARDLMHFGVKTHAIIADKVIHKLRSIGLQPKSDK